MELKIATTEEVKEVSSLYIEARSYPFSVWNKYYPTEEDAQYDAEHEQLYVLIKDTEIIGAISLVYEKEMDDYPHWIMKGNNAIEIARIVIKQKYHGHHYAAFMVNKLTEIIQNKGYQSIHLAVEANNIPAYKNYMKCNFQIVGEHDMYGHHYLMLEKIL